MCTIIRTINVKQFTCGIQKSSTETRNSSTFLGLLQGWAKGMLPCCHVLRIDLKLSVIS